MAIGYADLSIIQTKIEEDIVNGFLGGLRGFSKKLLLLQRWERLVLAMVAKHRLLRL